MSSFPLNYRTTMTQVAELAMDANEPGYVRAKMLCTLVRELSPLNERHAEVKRELGIEEEPKRPYRDVGAESRGYVKGFNDGLAAAEAEAAEREAEIWAEEEEGAEEEEDPL